MDFIVELMADAEKADAVDLADRDRSESIDSQDDDF